MTFETTSGNGCKCLFMNFVITVNLNVTDTGVRKLSFKTHYRIVHSEFQSVSQGRYCLESVQKTDNSCRILADDYMLLLSFIHSFIYLFIYLFI